MWIVVSDSYLGLGGGKKIRIIFILFRRTKNKQNIMESTSAAATADLSASVTQTQVLNVDELQSQVICNESQFHYL